MNATVFIEKKYPKIESSDVLIILAVAEKSHSAKKLWEPYDGTRKKLGKNTRILPVSSAAKYANGAWVGKDLRKNHLGYFILRKRCSKTYRFPCSPE
jgi:hypothetical protein